MKQPWEDIDHDRPWSWRENTVATLIVAAVVAILYFVRLLFGIH